MPLDIDFVSNFLGSDHLCWFFISALFKSVFYSRSFEQYRDMLKENAIVVMEGTLVVRDDEMPKINVFAVHPLEKQEVVEVKPVATYEGKTLRLRYMVLTTRTQKHEPKILCENSILSTERKIKQNRSAEVFAGV